MTAREQTLYYLGRFSRTEKQVRDYLKRKEFPPEEIADAIEYMRSLGYLNDLAFAQTLVQSKIRKGDGPLKIKQMLFQKGIDSATSERLLRELYPQELQVDAAVELLGRRASKASDREKAWRFLASRGFSRYVMIQAFKAITSRKNEHADRERSS